MRRSRVSSAPSPSPPTVSGGGSSGIGSARSRSRPSSTASIRDPRFGARSAPDRSASSAAMARHRLGRQASGRPAAGCRPSIDGVCAAVRPASIGAGSTSPAISDAAAPRGSTGSSAASATGSAGRRLLPRSRPPARLSAARRDPPAAASAARSSSSSSRRASSACMLEQALPVGDGDLVVVGMDFAEGEEAVPVAAVFDEGRLQAGLYPDHLGEIDVALELALGRCLDIEILEPVTIQHHHAGFFRVRGVDQHSLGHLVLNSDRPPGGAARIPVGCAPAGGGIGVWEGAGPSAQGSEHRPAEHCGSVSSHPERWGLTPNSLVPGRTRIMLPTIISPWRPGLAPGEVDCLPARSRQPIPGALASAARAVTRQRRTATLPGPRPAEPWSSRTTGRRFCRFHCPRRRVIPPAPGASPEQA